MALQLEGSRELAVTVVAGGVVFPTFCTLLLKLQVMFHVVHEFYVVLENFMTAETLECGVSLLFSVHQLKISTITSIIKVAN